MKYKILILLFLLVLGVIGISVYASENSKKTFKNENMSFEYPANWEVTVKKPEGFVIINKDPTHPVDSLSWNIITIRLLSEGEYSESINESDPLQAEKRVEVKNNITYTICTDVGGDGKVVSYYFQINGKYFCVDELIDNEWDDMISQVTDDFENVVYSIE